MRALHALYVGTVQCVAQEKISKFPGCQDSAKFPVHFPVQFLHMS